MNKSCGSRLLRNWVLAAWAGTLVVPLGFLCAADAPGVVCGVKVLSDKVEDVSSLEAWKKSFIKDGMSDQEKALAVWKTSVMFQHQDAPPQEFLHQLGDVMDAIKM